MSEIIFDMYGRARAIYSDDIGPIMEALGPARTARASHVEPDPRGGWYADMSPVGGPMIWSNGTGSYAPAGVPFKTRAEALTAERMWLDEHGIPIPLMAKVTVEIEIPNVTARQIRDNPDCYSGDKIIIDEACLERFPEEDSFFQFKLVKVEDS